MKITNPLIAGYHEFWRDKIREKFSINDSLLSGQDFLSLTKYLFNSPQKYYDEKAFKLYYDFLKNMLVDNLKALKDLFFEYNNDISVSNRVLNEVNNIEIYDDIISKNDSEVISEIQNQIIYNYLRILEAPFYALSSLIAKSSRLSRNVKTEGLNLYNVVQELNKTVFSPCTDVYDNILRNSIAHGKFRISSLSNLIIFTFYDSKGDTAEYEARKLINLYDRVLDVTNAFNLAYKLFCLARVQELTNMGFTIANSIYVDEIIASSEGPNWQPINI